MDAFQNLEMGQYKIGQRIGGEFKVLDVFGGETKSGMGVVYLVENRETSEQFVLKTFQQELEQGAKEQFVKEAKTWIDIGAHSNVVQAFWVREIANQLFIAAEYISPDHEQRNNLSQFLGVGTLPDEVITCWTAQFCFGMAHAVKHGLVAHRDIKPDNLMIDNDWNLRITDFGLAKPIDFKEFTSGNTKINIAKLDSLTKTGSAMGTLPYMAPEQFFDAKSVDHRADIYSFGIVLYQMVTGGQYPYIINNNSTSVDSEFFFAHTEQEPQPICSPFEKIIQICLAKSPTNRYASYDDLLCDLNSVAKQVRAKVPREVLVSKEDEDLYAKAQSYVALGNSGAALQAITEYVERWPGNPCGWTEKGRIHFERAEFDLALDATKRSIRLNPYNTHVWNNLGILLGKIKAPLDEIKDAFGKALYFDPGNSVAMMNLISPLALSKEYRELVEIVAIALHLYPDKPLVTAKAKALVPELIANKAFEEARRLLERLTRATPNDADSWYNLGLVAKQRGDIDDAIKYFREVRQLSADDGSAIEELAKLYFSKKKAKECLECCDELIRCSYNPLLAISMKAQILNFIGGYEHSLSFLEPYLKENPENDNLLLIAAEVHVYRDNYRAAIELLKRAKSCLVKSKNEHKEENLLFIEKKLEELEAKTPNVKG